MKSSVWRVLTSYFTPLRKRNRKQILDSSTGKYIPCIHNFSRHNYAYCTHRCFVVGARFRIDFGDIRKVTCIGVLRMICILWDAGRSIGFPSTPSTQVLISSALHLHFFLALYRFQDLFIELMPAKKCSSSSNGRLALAEAKIVVLTLKMALIGRGKRMSDLR